LTKNKPGDGDNARALDIIEKRTANDIP
jgi:hypothetical protein